MIISLLLFALAGFFNAVMDKLNFHYGKSVFADKNPKFWNPKKSWVNKYKDWPEDQRPKFPGAKTWAVGLTDAWHLAQGFMIFCFCLVPVLFNYPDGLRVIIEREVNGYLMGPFAGLIFGLTVFLLHFCAFTVTFTLFFHKLLNKGEE